MNSKYNTNVTVETLNETLLLVKKLTFDERENNIGLYAGETKTYDLSHVDAKRRNIRFYYCCNCGGKPEVNFGEW